MKKLFIVSFSLLLFSCSANQQTESPNTEPVEQTLEDKVDALLDADLYTEALELLADLEDTEEKDSLLETTYLNYGLFLEYRDSNVSNMRDKMNSAIRQYVEVLNINPDNEKAISEIKKILGIYAMFPDRSPDADVVESLVKLGFNI